MERRIQIGDDDAVQRTEVHCFEHSENVLSGAKDRRLVHRMLFYWASLKERAALPSIDNLDLRGMPEDWRQCFILARTGPDGCYGFDHLGRSFANDTGPNLPENTLDIMPGGLLYYAVRALPMAVEQRVPVTTGGAYLRAGNEVKFRSILLPFEGRASNTIYVLGAANGREDIHRHGGDIEKIRCYKFDHGVWVSAVLPPGAGPANDA